MKTLKRIGIIILSFITFILELLPNATVLKFISFNNESNIEYIYRYYSYFDLTPFGYASFGPLLTGVITCLILLLAVISFVRNKNSKFILGLSILGFITSIMPLFYGLDYFTIIGLFISIGFIINIIISINLQKEV